MFKVSLLFVGLLSLTTFAQGQLFKHLQYAELLRASQETIKQKRPEFQNVKLKTNLHKPGFSVLLLDDKAKGKSIWFGLLFGKCSKVSITEPKTNLSEYLNLAKQLFPTEVDFKLKGVDSWRFQDSSRMVEVIILDRSSLKEQPKNEIATTFLTLHRSTPKSNR